MEDSIKDTNTVEVNTENEISEEGSTVQTTSGLFCLHAVSKDKSQRFCTYKEYTEPTSVDQIQEDAYIWFKLQMTVSAVNESFNLYIQRVC